MSRQYNIKWREQDEQELRRVARNFNAKLSREVRKNPQNRNILPQFPRTMRGEEFESKITIGLLKELIATRNDYNRIINMLKRFSIRGAEDIVDVRENVYGAKTTKWERTELPRLAGIVNRRRGERYELLENIPMESSGGKLGYTLGQRFGMGLADRNKLKPTKAFTRGQSQTDIKQKRRALLIESSSRYHEDKDKFLKENYIKEIKKNFNQDDVQEVIDAIESMDSSMFYLRFQARGDRFESVYPPDRGSEEYWNYVSELKGYWLKDVTALDISRPLLTTLLNQ